MIGHHLCAFLGPFKQQTKRPAARGARHGSKSPQTYDDDDDSDVTYPYKWAYWPPPGLVIRPDRESTYDHNTTKVTFELRMSCDCWSRIQVPLTNADANAIDGYVNPPSASGGSFGETEILYVSGFTTATTLNGAYTKTSDASKMLNGKPTYWLSDNSGYIYWCELYTYFAVIKYTKDQWDSNASGKHCYSAAYSTNLFSSTWREYDGSVWYTNNALRVGVDPLTCCGSGNQFLAVPSVAVPSFTDRTGVQTPWSGKAISDFKCFPVTYDIPLVFDYYGKHGHYEYASRGAPWLEKNIRPYAVLETDAAHSINTRNAAEMLCSAQPLCEGYGYECQTWSSLYPSNCYDTTLTNVVFFQTKTMFEDAAYSPDTNALLPYTHIAVARIRVASKPQTHQWTVTCCTGSYSSDIISPSQRSNAATTGARTASDTNLYFGVPYDVSMALTFPTGGDGSVASRNISSMAGVWGADGKERNGRPVPLVLTPWFNGNNLRTLQSVPANQTACHEETLQANALPHGSQDYGVSGLLKYYDTINTPPLVPALSEQVTLVQKNNHPSPGSEMMLDVSMLTAFAPGAQTNIYTTFQYDNDTLIDLLLAVNNHSSARPGVLSCSFGHWVYSVDLSARRHANNLAKALGIMGTTVVIAGGDKGSHNMDSKGYTAEAVCGRLQGGENLLTSHATIVGAVQWMWDEGLKEYSSVACSIDTAGGITSPGGFDNGVNRTTSHKYQDAAVDAYLQRVGTDGAELLTDNLSFNKAGRAYPDISAIGHGIHMYKDKYIDYPNGGTSASAPIVAGMITLVNDILTSQGKPTVGFLNPSLYHIYETTPAAFVDVAKGNNRCLGQAPPYDMLCCAGGFEATPGWDPITGLGTINWPVFARELILLHGGDASQEAMNQCSQCAEMFKCASGVCKGVISGNKNKTSTSEFTFADASHKCLAVLLPDGDTCSSSSDCKSGVCRGKCCGSSGQTDGQNVTLTMVIARLAGLDLQ